MHVKYLFISVLTFIFSVLNCLDSLAKWFSVRLQTKWLWGRTPLLSLSIYIYFKFLFISIFSIYFSIFNIFDLSLLCWHLPLVKAITFCEGICLPMSVFHAQFLLNYQRSCMSRNKAKEL